MEADEVLAGAAGDEGNAAEVAADVVVEVGGDPFADLVELVLRHQAPALDDEDGDEECQAENHRGAPGRVEFAFGSELVVDGLERGEFAFDLAALRELVEPGADRGNSLFRGVTVGEGGDVGGFGTVRAGDGATAGQVLTVRPNLDFREGVNFLIS